MIEKLIITLIVAGITASIKVLDRKGYVQVLINQARFHIAPPKIHNQKLLTKEITKLQAVLIRKLVSDQNNFGNHRGQYGKSFDAISSEKYQTETSGENLKLKPRMYLTYWPVMIMNKHRVAHKSVAYAFAGIERLFIDGRIPLFSSGPELSPIRREQKWNYRHSLAGAHILAIYQHNNSTTRSVVGQMLDKNKPWQDISGGWWQTSEKTGKPDIWASAYALKLLDFVSTNQISAFTGETSSIKQATEQTISFLETDWERQHWGDPGRLLTEETLVLMFIELSPILSRYSSELKIKCISAMKEWLNPAGNLSNAYLAKLAAEPNPIFQEQAYVRMAYACYLAKDNSLDWRPLFEKAVRSPLNHLYSTDWAFLLDLSFVYNNEIESELTTK
jgi:hypothetical protein